MNLYRNLGKAAAVSFLALAMAGCGGGSDSAGTTVMPEPEPEPEPMPTPQAQLATAQAAFESAQEAVDALTSASSPEEIGAAHKALATARVQLTVAQNDPANRADAQIAELQRTVSELTQEVSDLEMEIDELRNGPERARQAVTGRDQRIGGGAGGTEHRSERVGRCNR